MLEQAAPPPTAPLPTSATLLVAGDGAPVTVERRGSAIEAVGAGRTLLSLRLDGTERRLDLVGATGDARTDERALSAVVEALFGWQPERPDIRLDLGTDEALARSAVRSGLALMDAEGLIVRPDLAMQRRGNWLAEPDTAPFPLDYVMSGGKRHPRRPGKPEGTVYARHIPWLGQTVSFRTLTLDDVPLFNRWMNDPRIAAFWGEEGGMEKHRAYLSELIADPHMLPLIGSFDGKSFGYFEIYWAKENRIAPFYEAQDYDRGWHVAVGEDVFRGRAYISAWLPSLMHYLFLDDPRTGRIVGEPAAAHTQQIRNLEVSGFAKLKNFDFPHKRATLVMLLRERFFGDRLWLPVASAQSGAGR